MFKDFFICFNGHSTNLFGDGILEKLYCSAYDLNIFAINIVGNNNVKCESIFDMNIMAIYGEIHFVVAKDNK